MVHLYQTTLCYSKQSSELHSSSFECEVTEVPEDRANKQQPYGQSLSLGSSSLLSVIKQWRMQVFFSGGGFNKFS
jgi:hypothetical protein